MTTDPPPRKRRSRNAARIRDGLNAIGAELEARIPPPSPPGLGEGLLERAARRPFAMPDDHEPGPEGGSRERMLIALARIEERQLAMLDASKAGQAAAEARHTNVMQAIATFVPRSEIEKDNRLLHERIDEVEKRVKAVENRIWAGVALVLTTLFGAVASLFGVHVKP